MKNKKMKEKTVEIKYIIPKSLEAAVHQRLLQKIKEETEQQAEDVIRSTTFKEIEKYILQEARKLLDSKEVKSLIKKVLRGAITDILEDSSIEDLISSKGCDKFYALVGKSIEKTMGLE